MDRIKLRPAVSGAPMGKAGKGEMNSTPIRTRDLHNKENQALSRNQNMPRKINDLT